MGPNKAGGVFIYTYDKAAGEYTEYDRLTGSTSPSFGRSLSTWVGRLEAIVGQRNGFPIIITHLIVITIMIGVSSTGKYLIATEVDLEDGAIGACKWKDRCIRHTLHRASFSHAFFAFLSPNVTIVHVYKKGAQGYDDMTGEPVLPTTNTAPGWGYDMARISENGKVGR